MQSSDFAIGRNPNPGELPEELAKLMQENSLSLEELKRDVATKKSLGSRLPEPSHT
jgi:hypothetical protein